MKSKLESLNLSRRDWVRSALLMSVAPQAVRAAQRPLLPTGVVLFQGDSITDAGRNRERTAPNDSSGMGRGYPLLIASHLLGSRPQDGLRVYNRGISGNKVPDLEARWQIDTLGLQTRPVEHSRRRQRHLAQARRKLQRDGRELRERLRRTACEDAQGDALHAHRRLRAVRAALRRGHGRLVPRIRSPPRRRSARCSSGRRRLGSVSVDVRQSPEARGAGVLGRGRRTPHLGRPCLDGENLA